MKKLQFKVLMAVVISVIISQNASSQLLASNAKFETASASFSATGNTSAFKSEAKLNKAGLKAMKGLQSSFSNAKEAVWNVQGTDILAIVPTPGGRTYVSYCKHGNWQNSMAIYDESHMPKDIREIVKRSIYFDDTINTIQEVTCDLGTYYVVHLENEKEYKQVCVFEGALTLIKQLKKA